MEKQVILAAPREQLLREWIEWVPDGQTLLWMGIRKNGDASTLRTRLAQLQAEDFAGITQLQIHVEAAEVDGNWTFKPSLSWMREAAELLKAGGVLFQSLPWDCDDPEVYRALCQAGVQSFASDYPAVALRVLGEANRSQPMTLEAALEAARETKVLRIGEGITPEVARVFEEQFGDQEAIVISDSTTFEVAGRGVCQAFGSAGQPLSEPFIFSDPDLHAEFGYVEELEAVLRRNLAIPIAVGSGVINDLVKLAAHRVGRPYLCVATAASMDGYTAFGASITHEGSKQTFNCPAPVGVVADLSVLCNAPRSSTASGYADLLAKIPAGADWLIADALEIEPIDPTAWRIVQGGLHEALGDPDGVSQNQSAAISRLTEGLMLGGFAMQWAKTSRPASGAEHQFSHLWDMQHHTFEGAAPSHGFKVGIGTLAVTALYEWLLEQPLEALDIDQCCARWPEKARIAQMARETLGELGERETAAKWIGRAELRVQLEKLCEVWPALKDQLRAQLIPFAEVQHRLRVVGAPCEPEQIGISRARLRQSFAQAALIRRRFTVLDLALRTGTLEAALEHIFGKAGRWKI